MGDLKALNDGLEDEIEHAKNLDQGWRRAHLKQMKKELEDILTQHKQRMRQEQVNDLLEKLLFVEKEINRQIDVNNYIDGCIIGILF